MEVVKKEDYEIVSRAYGINTLNGKKTDILDLYDGLGYEITEDLVAEAIEVDEFELIELETTKMRFAIDPESENFGVAKTLLKKLRTLGNENKLIAISWGLKEKSIKQNAKGLTTKRISMPKYAATIIRATGLINCKNEHEILNYNFNKDF